MNGYPPTIRSWLGLTFCWSLAALMVWFALTAEPAAFIMAAFFLLFGLVAWDEGKL